MANMEYKSRFKTWDLRFIERDGQRVLQQRFFWEIFDPAHDPAQRYEDEWQDVPLAEMVALESKKEIGKRKSQRRLKESVG
jgi:hypothetical protein